MSKALVGLVVGNTLKTFSFLVGIPLTVFGIWELIDSASKIAEMSPGYAILFIIIGLGLLSAAIIQGTTRSYRLVSRLHEAHAEGWKIARQEIDLDKNFEKWSEVVNGWFQETASLIAREVPSALPIFYLDPVQPDEPALGMSLEKKHIQRLGQLGRVIEGLGSQLTRPD